MNNNPQADLELRLRTLRMVWISMFFSLGGLVVLTILQKRSEDITPNHTLSLVLLLLGASTTLISFLIRSKLLSRAVDHQQVPLVQQAYIVGWAVNEVTALLGVIDFFVTGHRHFYILLIISGLGLLLQFPRREPVVNAAFKGSGFLAAVILLLVSSPMVSSQQKPEPAHKLVEFHMALLKHGPKWTATEEIQKGHMANINRLAEMKKLIAAGPFGDDGRLRGIFVFRVESLEEAQNLTASDPAIRAGRLAMDIHLWMVPDGILP